MNEFIFQRLGYVNEVLVKESERPNMTILNLFIASQKYRLCYLYSIKQSEHSESVHRYQPNKYIFLIPVVIMFLIAITIYDFYLAIST